MACHGSSRLWNRYICRIGYRFRIGVWGFGGLESRAGGREGGREGFCVGRRIGRRVVLGGVEEGWEGWEEGGRGVVLVDIVWFNLP